MSSQPKVSYGHRVALACGPVLLTIMMCLQTWPSQPSRRAVVRPW